MALLHHRTDSNHPCALSLVCLWGVEGEESMTNLEDYHLFRDTKAALLECYNRMDGELSDPGERKAKEAIIRLCTQIANEHGGVEE